jgi:glutamate-1-semialdehyde aminotransferase
MSIKARSHVIAQGALTNSKHPDRFSEFVPSHVKGGYGEYLYDGENNRWLDFVCGLGACHFGYGHEKIVREIVKYICQGSCHSLPTEWEVFATEKLQEVFNFVESVKWVNDGSSACTAAIEIARAHTGRDWILTEGYHGWHPEHINPVAWKKHPNRFCIEKLDMWARPWDDVAAVIIEPVMTVCDEERISFLKDLREKCTKTGTLLIYDEVITGLRYPKFGVCNHFGVKPDILLLGKSIGNGEKIGAVCGKKEWMNGEYFVSGTYHGHIPSLVAAHTCLHLAKHDQEFDLVHLNNESLRFVEAINDMAKDIFSVEAWGCRGAFKGDYHLFHQEMAKAKVLFGPSLFFNFANIKHIDDILDLSYKIIERIKAGSVTFVGKVPTPALASKARS